MPQNPNRLPTFATRDYEKVLQLMTDILTPPHLDESTLIQLTSFNDGHFRAIFNPNYFVLADNRDIPSKSQWNTLKKKLKRHDKRIFVFKKHGIIEHQKDGSQQFYVDFGFFVN